MVAESHRWFLGLVADRRKLDPQSIPGLVQGRIFSGRQAVTLKLIDALGSEREAVSWLEKTRGIKPGLRIVEWKKSSTSTLSAVPGLRQAMAALLGGSAGLVADRIADSPVLQRLTLDGLVSVWHGTEN
jgi:protease-4